MWCCPRPGCPANLSTAGSGSGRSSDAMTKLVTAIVFVMCAISVAVHTAGRTAARPLAVVLRDLQSLGVKVVFSPELVWPEMRVMSEPKGTSPRQILDVV